MPVEYRNSHPYWYYRRVELADRGVSLGTQVIAWRLKSGFDYWIRGILISYPYAVNVGFPDDISNHIRLELIQNERNRMITAVPIPVELCSNPGGIQPPPPGHVQEERRSLRRGWIPWDYMLSDSDVLYLRITGQANGSPEFVRLCVTGQNVKSKLYDS